MTVQDDITAISATLASIRDIKSGTATTPGLTSILTTYINQFNAYGRLVSTNAKPPVLAAAFAAMTTTLTLYVTQFDKLTALIATLGTQVAQLSVDAAPAPSSSAALGINLSGVSYFASSMPLINCFKVESFWAGVMADGSRHGSETIDLDANGYPRSMNGIGAMAGQTFHHFDTLFFRSLGIVQPDGSQVAPFYHAGQRSLQYDGEGSFTYDFDGARNASLSKPGRDVIDVNPTGGGIRVNMVTDPNGTGNYVKNIRFARVDQEALLASGEIFNPDYSARLKPFNPLRHMDWNNANNNAQIEWIERSLPSDCFWLNKGAMPYEVQIALCNKLGVGGYFNVPGLASDDCVRQMATLLKTTMGPFKVFVEYFNEPWNEGASSITPQLRALGGGPPDNWGASFNYCCKRAVQVMDIFKQVFGDDPRLVRVAAGQGGYPARFDYLLDYTDPSYVGPAGTHFDVGAVAPYFGYDGVPEGTTLDQLFKEMMSGGAVTGGYPGGMIKQTMDWVVQNVASAARYKLPLIGYEAGPSLVASNSPTLTNLYIAANRDPRMAAAMQALYNGWKAAGGTTICHYNDIGTFSKWGCWPLLENVEQTSSSKYDEAVKLASA